jgi:hypothetical protein
MSKAALIPYRHGAINHYSLALKDRSVFSMTSA